MSCHVPSLVHLLKVTKTHQNPEINSRIEDDPVLIIVLYYDARI